MYCSDKTTKIQLFDNIYMYAFGTYFYTKRLVVQPKIFI